jgi:3-keto-5-aminohexanoate cleavage enzyme
MAPQAPPLIINLCPTGMVPTKAMTPHVPVTTEEILDDVERCSELGASMIHVHARDEQGLPTHRPEYFGPIIEGIRRIDPELIVVVTCSGRLVSAVEQRGEVLGLQGQSKPDMASLTLGSNNFAGQASVNSPQVVRGLAERMRSAGILPELEVFEPGMLDFGNYLAKEGLFPTPAYVNVLLGNLGTSPLSPASLAAFLALVPDKWNWALAGIGRFQLDAAHMAVAAGGHVRIGLEDNIWLDRGRTTLASNAQLVERVARIAELAERPVATPRETRDLLGLPSLNPGPKLPGARPRA